MKSQEVKSIGQFLNNPIVDRNYHVLGKSGEIIITNLLRDYIARNNKTYWEAHIFALFDTWVYDSHGSDCFRHGCYIDEGDVVLDIGANLGVFAMRAACHKPSRIICIEPMIENFMCLVNNKPGDSVDCYNIALSATNSLQNITVHTDFTHSGGASISTKFEDHGLKTIKSQNTIALTLDFMFDSGMLPSSIDFMKMDIEGAEFNVLDGLSDNNLLKIKKATIELHVKTDDPRIKQIADRFIGLGYSSFIHYYTNGQQHLNVWKA